MSPKESFVENLTASVVNCSRASLSMLSGERRRAGSLLFYGNLKTIFHNALLSIVDSINFPVTLFLLCSWQVKENSHVMDLSIKLAIIFES